MSYIKKVAGRDEKILMILRPHWIYLLEGILWFIALTLLGFVGDYYLYGYAEAHNFAFSLDFYFFQVNQNTLFLPWVFGFVGFGIFWPLALAYASTEVGLTNQRIIYKKGLIFIEVDQVELDDIKAEQVYHGWLGWALGYGRIHLDCRFVGDVWLPAIYKPYKLLKSIHVANMRHPDIDYTTDHLNENLKRIEQKEKENSAREVLKIRKDFILSVMPPKKKTLEIVAPGKTGEEA